MPDREKVIRGLEVCIEADFTEGKNPCAPCPYFFDGMCKYVIMKDALALLREQKPVGGWISVTERMPEEEGEYIAFDGETVFGAYYEINAFGTKWTDATEGYCDFKVTHWMPLPEPPKEVSGDA